MKKQLLILVAAILTTLSALAQQPPDVVLQKDVVYGHADGVDLLLNLAKPAGADAPLPTIVYVHGGGWEAGNKDESEPLIRLLASYGYAAVSVGYRLTPAHKWPAQIQDAKCAVRYLRANAATLGIDPDNIGAMGDSAGGHLVLLLALMDGTGPFDEGGGNPGPSSKVKAVVNLFGPTDFTSWQLRPLGLVEIRRGFGKSFDELLVDLVGTADRSAAVMKEVSPVTYIDAGDPPVLTFHGDKDPLVPVDQAHILHQALDKAGVPNRLVVVEKAAHGWGGEKYENTLRLTREFFDKHLKGIAAAAP
ncbi:MAG TPA: alpha/beta hydrolase [Candidatus Bathyarchaeia archaeon]|nr:alpha/beta hydrolase [Candidatus Bathyarchaeia archaeon]